MSETSIPGNGAILDDERALRDQLELLSANAEREHRALIVDHDRARLTEITNSLKLQGFMCAEAPSVSTGFERMEQYGDITLVLISSDLPNNGAEELVLKMKRHFADRHYSVLMMADNNVIEFLIKELGADVFAFLPMPVRMPHLLHLTDLARRVSDLYYYEHSLKEFLIEEGSRRSRQIQRLKKEISDIDSRLGMGNEAQRRTQHVQNLMKENRDLRLQLEMEKNKK